MRLIKTACDEITFILIELVKGGPCDPLMQRWCDNSKSCEARTTRFAATEDATYQTKTVRTYFHRTMQCKNSCGIATCCDIQKSFAWQLNAAKVPTPTICSKRLQNMASHVSCKYLYNLSIPHQHKNSSNTKNTDSESHFFPAQDCA